MALGSLMQLLRQGLGRLDQCWGSGVGTASPALQGAARAVLSVWEGRQQQLWLLFILTEPPVGSSIRKMDSVKSLHTQAMPQGS